MQKCTTISSTSKQSLKHTKFHTSSFVFYVNLICNYYQCWVYILVPRQSFKKFKFLVIFKLGQNFRVLQTYPLKRILSSRFELILEQIGKLFFKIIFSFPCVFCLCMITPLYPIESYCCPPSLSGDCIQYPDWSFLILQIQL